MVLRKSNTHGVLHGIQNEMISKQLYQNNIFFESTDQQKKMHQLAD